MTSLNRPLVYASIIILIVPMVFLQKIIDPQRHQFEPKLANVNNAVRELPVEFALGAVTGFSQAIAGLLWVRTDEFFHEGNYDAIVPMVRIVTWLDPHNIDVYETGAWHLDYNFTDANQRSDRRYIPVSIALLEEGIANNPDVPDLYSDLAFTHFFRKIGDYPKSVYWYQQAEKIPGWDVTSVGHGLAHAYQADGNIPAAIAQWQYCIQQHQVRMRTITDSGLRYAEQSGLNVARKNLIEIEARAKWRQLQTKPPYDAGFTAKLTRIAPMQFVVSGTFTGIGSQPGFNLQTGQHVWGPVDGCRVDFRLQDSNYVIPASTSFGLTNNVPENVTIMQDSASVRQGKFQRRVDMSEDHVGQEPMYSFTAPKYTVTIWFNPANPNSTPPNVGDRIGWLGEGLTDSNPNYIDRSGNIPMTAGGNIPGLLILKKTFTLTRDDIMGQGIKEFN
jgi:hypothetical protein